MFTPDTSKETFPILRKKAKNNNIATISVLLYYTLDLDIASVNLGQAILKIGNPDFIIYWIWFFFGFYTFRFLQAYFSHSKADKQLLFWEDNILRWVKIFFPLKYDHAFINNTRNNGEFKRDRIYKGSYEYREHGKMKVTNYYIEAPTPDGTHQYYIPLSNWKIKLIQILIFVPWILWTNLSKPDFFTIHLPFVGYLILSLNFIFF
ncbi:hypothetical protein SAMN05421640_3102 [Ekhidna lutea]|uniref:Uncharacterized protein n=1 Tax=Ekhidna lutea TaxID=447679 RepID=A0A239LCP9_EKHLU|nr:hypothetical protein [Ekhidna lutea]SNT27409.1 hypothetical protein SAMN05421640_3102 [Ekhidna lutea]